MAEPQPDNDDNNGPIVKAHDRLSALFAGYAAFTTRHTFFTFFVGIVLMFLLCLGLIVSERELDMDELWIQTNSRIQDERTAFDAKFGGLTRKEYVAVVARDGSSITSEAHLNALRAVLIPILDQNAAGNPDQLKLDTNIGRSGGGLQRYTQKDFCESPPPPVALQAGGLVANGILYLSNCMNEVKSNPLPTGWHVDRFPCSRSSVLDCFSEGNFDYPIRMKEMDDRRTLFKNGVANATGYQTCLGGVPQADGSVEPFITNRRGYYNVLNPGVSSVSVAEARTTLTTIHRTLDSFINSWGYHWRVPYTGKNSASILAHINQAIANSVNQSLGVRDCVAGGLPCCLTWDGRKIDEQVILGGFASTPASSFKSTRTIINNFHQNHPQWVSRIGITSENNRKKLVREWEQVMINFLKPKWDQTSDSNFKEGEVYGSSLIRFSMQRSVEDVLRDGSTPETPLLIAGFVIMVLYATMSLSKISHPYTGMNAVYSRTWLGLVGVIIVSISTAAGFGFTALLGIKLSPISVNLVPFIALGMGINDVFVLVHTLISFKKYKVVVSRMKLTKAVAGGSITFTSLANMAAFFVAVITPIKAVQSFALQMAVTVVVNYIAILLIFVPCLVWDAHRTSMKRTDCFVPPCVSLVGRVPDEDHSSIRDKGATVRVFMRDRCGPCMATFFTKVIIVLGFFIFFCVMLLLAISDSEDGLRISDIAVKGSYPHDFAELEETDFGSYENVLYTAPSDYTSPTAQAGLLSVEDQLQQSPWVVQSTRIKDLAWNTDAQFSFYFYAKQNGFVQDLNTPVAAVNFSTIFADWVKSSGAAMTPDLYCELIASSTRVDCSTFTAGEHKLVATKVNVFNRNLYKHDNFLDAIKENRKIVDNVPNGNSFMYGTMYQFWEQFLDIEADLLRVAAFSLCAVLGVALIFSFSLRAAFLLAIVVLMIDVEVWGFMVVLGVKVNAFSVVNVAMAVGFGVEYTAHFTNMFLMQHGTRDHRMIKALTEMMPPMVNSVLSSLLGLIPLAFGEFPFFRTYYFGMLFCAVLIAFVNGMVLLPVLLSLMGPVAFHHQLGEEERSPPVGQAGVELASRGKDSL